MKEVIVPPADTDVGGGSSSGCDEAEEADALRRRLLAAELYRPLIARLIILGEAPPPARFFYFGNSLFFRFLRQAFIRVVPDVAEHDADWFLAFYRDIGGWRSDVCDRPQRATKGGADDISGCLDAFLMRWEQEPKDDEAIVIISPKRLVPRLPESVRERVLTSVPPPGQWNAHRQAFLREMERVLRHHVGVSVLETAARAVDAEDATLEFDIARACADGTEAGEIERLINGHPREMDLRRVWRSVPVQEEQGAAV